MSFLSSFMIPFLICLIFAYALTHKVDLVSAFSTGVCDGLKIVLNMFPALLLLTLTISAFRSSGALQLLSRALETPAAALGIPSPILPLTLLRPLSGSGALVVFEDILTQYGPGQPDRKDCQRYDGFHRNHLLYHCAVLLGG